MPIPVPAPDAPPRAPEPAISVRVLRGAEAGRFCLLGAAPVVVGSSAAHGLCIADRHVSRAHCEIFAREGQYFVRDLDSTNGTFVDGARVSEASIGFESRVRIGNTELGLHAQTDLPQASDVPIGGFGDMVGRSEAAQRVFAALRSIAGSSLSCLLLGETGTGKELGAKALHDHSARAGKPFLVVDCASVGAQFIEDKLFGHERGAFTGASSAVPGVFEQARGGTVFLDEIGELPLPLQAKLLGVLERREATRIGSHTPIKLDIRLVAATHRNPAEMVRCGEFRQDLLYRISEFTLRIPALRERKEDIGPIALSILNREGHARSLSSDAIAYLEELEWPGNVRELRNVMRRAVVLAQGLVIDRRLLRSLEEVTAEIQIPDFLRNPSSPAAGPSFAPRESFSPQRRDSVRTPERMPENSARSVQPARPASSPDAAAADVEEAFALPLAEATEAFRRAYARELRRRFGDDLIGASAHAGVHPKSVSRLYRLYGIS